MGQSGDDNVDWPLLPEFSIEDIIKELQSRCDSCVILLRFEDAESLKHQSEYKGSLDAVIGIMERELHFQKEICTQRRILEFNEQSEEGLKA